LISTEIDFLAPDDLAGVLATLDEHGDDVTVLSGGMSLIPMMNLGLAAPERVVSLRRVAELTGVVDEDDAVLVGGMVAHVVVAAHPGIRAAAPALATAASLLGDVQVRNRGTIGGSVAHADPAADYLPCLCAHRGQIVLESKRDGRRVVDAANFFIDMMYTAREPHELVTGVRLPRAAPGAVSEYIRFARVEGSFAIVNAAVVLNDNGASRISLGGVGPAPVTLDITEFGASGWDAAAAAAVGDAVFDACEDVRGDIMSDAEYRREMARVHARRVVLRAVEKLDGTNTDPKVVS
jgi:carbon-monoxide dehydrogenase medium subunit